MSYTELPREPGLSLVGLVEATRPRATVASGNAEDRRTRGGPRCRHGRAARRPGTGRGVRPGHGRGTRPAPGDGGEPAWCSPGQTCPSALAPGDADPRRAVSGAARRPDGCGRTGSPGLRGVPLLPGRSRAPPAGAPRTAVHLPGQPAVPRRSRARPGPGTPDGRDRRPVRGCRPGYQPGPRPRHRRADTAARRRRGDCRRRSGGRRDRARRPDASLALHDRLRPTGGRPTGDPAEVRHSTPSLATGRTGRSEDGRHRCRAGPAHPVSCCSRRRRTGGS
jgi:hypothetical protein